MPHNPELLAHQQWLGYLQPVGLVVSPPALVTAGAVVPPNDAARHARFLEHLDESGIKDLTAFLTDPVLFDWKPADLASPPDSLEVVLTTYNETLRPTFAVPDGDGWLLIIQEHPRGTDLDLVADDAKHWEASAQKKFERLLRESGVSIGLLFNGTELRLVYNPPVDNPGHITFPVAAMRETAGRPILSALLMLLGADRLFTLPDNQRLPALLVASRKYQNEVSTELAEQVLAALFEFLRGFQAADDKLKNELLRAFLADESGREEVYAGLVTVLMRLVFLLYAEDRGLLSDSEIYIKHYSVTGLFERLREDAGRYPDTMDHRYGAWAQLIALFRLVYDGGGHGKFRLPQRHGHLFDPDRFPFLEGRPRRHQREPGVKIVPPLVSDGVIFRVLANLLIVAGERLSYAHLDVEHIGSVYESIMGYRLEKAEGRSIAFEAKKRGGAPVTVNLEALLAVKAGERAKWLAEHADQKVDGKPLAALKAADSVEGLVAALEKRVARALTPNIVPPGGMVFQPSDERRRSGSHYTPRTLTGPIVKKALEPVLKNLVDSQATKVASGEAPEAPPLPAGERSPFRCERIGTAGEGRFDVTPGTSNAPHPVRELHAQFANHPLPSGERVSDAQVPDDLIDIPAPSRRDAEPSAPQTLGPTPEQILALKVCDPAMGSGAFLVEACRQLGDALLAAWTAHGSLPRIPDDETPELFAQRTIAQRCLYGVDRNAMAVDLAKLSLWLATLAKNHPFTFLDHSLKCGDSLVGLTAKQIRTAHWNPGEKEQMLAGQQKLREKVEAATRYRRDIIDAGEETPHLLKEQKLKLVEEALGTVRFAATSPWRRSSPRTRTRSVKRTAASTPA